MCTHPTVYHLFILLYIKRCYSLLSSIFSFCSVCVWSNSKVVFVSAKLGQWIKSELQDSGTGVSLTIVRKMPNSGLISTWSPSVKTKFLRRSFLHVRTIAICWAATDKTGRSMRLNSSKQPQEPDWARPGNQTHGTLVTLLEMNSLKL